MNFYENLGPAMENLTKRGAFLTAKSGQGVNTMTISWGYVGFSWKKPFFVAMVRPQRYTYEFLKEGMDYTVSIPFGNGMNKALGICGSKSGRDVDKEKEAGIQLIPARFVNTPVVAECGMYYECKLTYVDQIDKNAFPEELKENYVNDDYHYLFYGEIVACYEG